MSANEHLTVHHGDVCEWRGRWAVDQKLSYFSHCPDPREPRPLPAGLSVDVTADSIEFSSFPMLEETAALTL